MKPPPRFSFPSKLVLGLILAVGLTVVSHAQVVYAPAGNGVGANGRGQSAGQTTTIMVRTAWGIRYVTVRARTRRSSVIARNFFFAGGVNLGNRAPAKPPAVTTVQAGYRYAPRAAISPPRTPPQRVLLARNRR
jgi:hypothetical protein